MAKDRSVGVHPRRMSTSSYRISPKLWQVHPGVGTCPRGSGWRSTVGARTHRATRLSSDVWSTTRSHTRPRRWVRFVATPRREDCAYTTRMTHVYSTAAKPASDVKSTCFLVVVAGALAEKEPQFDRNALAAAAAAGAMSLFIIRLSSRSALAIARSSRNLEDSPSLQRHRHPHAHHSIAYSQLSEFGLDMTATQKLRRLNLETCPGHEWSRPRKRVSPKRSIETYHSHCGLCGIRRSRRSIEALKEVQIAEDQFLAGGPPPASFSAVAEKPTKEAGGQEKVVAALVVAGILLCAALLVLAVYDLGAFLLLGLVLIGLIGLLSQPASPSPSSQPLRQRAMANRLAHAAWGRKTWRGNMWSR